MSFWIIVFMIKPENPSVFWVFFFSFLSLLLFTVPCIPADAIKIQSFYVNRIEGPLFRLKKEKKSAVRQYSVHLHTRTPLKHLSRKEHCKKKNAHSTNNVGTGKSKICRHTCTHTCWLFIQLQYISISLILHYYFFLNGSFTIIKLAVYKRKYCTRWKNQERKRYQRGEKKNHFIKTFCLHFFLCGD